MSYDVKDRNTWPEWLKLEREQLQADFNAFLGRAGVEAQHPAADVMDVMDVVDECEDPVTCAHCGYEVPGSHANGNRCLRTESCERRKADRGQAN